MNGGRSCSRSSERKEALKRQPNKRVCLPVLLVFFCFLAGCQGVPVADQLDQTEANRIVALLNANGISALAKKEAGGRGKVEVVVDRHSYTQAATLLSSKKLPGENQLSFAQIVASQGLLPNSREMEHLKLDHALALEIQSLLENHPSIESAKVVLRQNFLREGEQPVVSAIIAQKHDSELSNEEVSGIIQRTVPGITHERISIAIHPAAPEQPFGEQKGVAQVDGKPVLLSLASFLGFWRVPKDDYVSLACTLAGLLVLCLCVGSMVGYWYGYYVQSKHFFDIGSMELLPKVTRTDTKRSDR